VKTPPRRRTTQARPARGESAGNARATKVRANRSRPSARGRGAVVALTTAGSREEAERLAQALIGDRLAACVNLVAPITSIYRWRGAVERAEEVLLVIKTRRTLVPGLGVRLRELHSYEVPELIVLPVADGSENYLEWLREETRTLRART